MANDKKPGPLSLWLNPGGLVVLVAAGVTAALASMPVILVPGFLAYGILTFLRYQRAAEADANSEFAPADPDTSALQKPYAARILRSVTIQKTILLELSSAAAEHRALLAGTAARVRHLVEAVAKLTAQLQELDRHLSATSPHDLAAETRDLEKRVAAAHDAMAKEGYERALSQQKQKTKVFGELAARRERLDAQVVNVEQSLETVSTQVVRIKSTDSTAASAEGVRIAESLDALAVDIDAVAETVDEAASAYRQIDGR
jgi:uncharacterized coiled-coil protein SlyX/uncharacterized protein YdcH (DUF465 family)